MRIQDKARTEDAVYWKQQAVRDNFGNRQFDAPIEIKVRWNISISEQQTNQEDTGRSSESVLVGIDMEPGDFLMPRLIETGTDESNPQRNPTAKIVKSFTKTANLRGTQHVRYAHL